MPGSMVLASPLTTTALPAAPADPAVAERTSHFWLPTFTDAVHVKVRGQVPTTFSTRFWPGGFGRGGLATNERLAGVTSSEHPVKTASIPTALFGLPFTPSPTLFDAF